MKSIFKILAAATVLAAFQANAADPQAGKKIAENVCGACHGVDGKSENFPAYPMLAGQYPDYIVHALKGYQSGARQNPIMGGIVGNLSEQDMRNVAAWYASREPGVEDTPDE